MEKTTKTVLEINKFLSPTTKQSIIVKKPNGNKFIMLVSDKKEVYYLKFIDGQIFGCKKWLFLTELKKVLLEQKLKHEIDSIMQKYINKNFYFSNFQF